MLGQRIPPFLTLSWHGAAGRERSLIWHAREHRFGLGVALRKWNVRRHLDLELTAVDCEQLLVGQRLHRGGSVWRTLHVALSFQNWIKEPCAARKPYADGEHRCIHRRLAGLHSRSTQNQLGARPPRRTQASCAGVRPALRAGKADSFFWRCWSRRALRS